MIERENFEMKMQAETEIVVDILKAAINQQSFKVGKREILWEKVEKILKFHNVMNIAWHGYLQMEDKERMPETLKEKMEKADEFATVKEVYQQFSLEEIREAFEQNKISFVALKGCVLKRLYPLPQMRLMSDLDILFKEEQKDAVDRCLKELGYNAGAEDFVHDVYKRKPFMCVEMHKQLIRKPKEQKKYFDGIWERMEPATGKKFECEMSLEDYYLFFLAHMAKHFSLAGTGLRSLTDFHVFYKNESDKLDRKVLNKRLKEIRLDKFEEFLIEMDACVFGGKEWPDMQLRKVFEYMIASGIYGIKSNRLKNEVSGKDASGRFLIFQKVQGMLKTIFLNRKGMEMLYPWLKGRPYLLIPAWIYRAFNRIVHRREAGITVLRRYAEIDSDEVMEVFKIQQRAGLKE